MKKENTEEKSLNEGHRERLRDRYKVDRGASMPDYELLELLLMAGIPRRDVKDDAKELLIKFGSLAKILAASDEELAMAGVPKVASHVISLVSTLHKRVSWQNLKENDDNILKSFDSIINYCRTNFGHLSYEEVHLIFLDSSLRVMTTEKLHSGTGTAVSVSMDEVVRMALNHRASKVIMAHNHPGGKCRPSPSDVLFTQKVVEAFSGLNVQFFDHIIITEDDYYSFRENDMLPLK